MAMETEDEVQVPNTCCSELSCLYPKLVERYDPVKEIGRGGQGVVFLCRNKVSKKAFACKVMPCEDAACREKEIMQLLCNTPGVVRLHEVIQDDGFWHLIMELCECSLTDVIIHKGRLCEKEAALLTRNLAMAIKNLHDKGVIHRDLKPGNILVASSEKPYDIRVSDFGFSARFSDDNSNLTSMVGTPTYLAPELVQGRYSKEIDIWGLGLILYQALTGSYHFSDLENEQIVDKLLHGEDLAASHLYWPHGKDGEVKVSEEAKSLVLAMLRPDPQERVSLEQVLTYPWVLKHSSSTPATATATVAEKKRIMVQENAMLQYGDHRRLCYKRPELENKTIMKIKSKKQEKTMLQYGQHKRPCYKRPCYIIRVLALEMQERTILQYGRHRRPCYKRPCYNVVPCKVSKLLKTEETCHWQGMGLAC